LPPIKRRDLASDQEIMDGVVSKNWVEKEGGGSI